MDVSPHQPTHNTFPPSSWIQKQWTWPDTHRLSLEENWTNTLAHQSPHLPFKENLMKNTHEILLSSLQDHSLAEEIHNSPYQIFWVPDSLDTQYNQQIRSVFPMAASPTLALGPWTFLGRPVQVPLLSIQSDTSSQSHDLPRSSYWVPSAPPSQSQASWLHHLHHHWLEAQSTSYKSRVKHH